MARLYKIVDKITLVLPVIARRSLRGCVCMLTVLLGHVPSPALALEIYISPDGTDANNGSLAAPLSSINGAQNAIKKLGASLDEDVTVFIKPGLYESQSVIWRVINRGHWIRFVSSSKERPIFDGAKKGLTFFQVNAAPGLDVNIEIRGLRVRNYKTAISLNGDRDQLQTFNSSVRIIDNEFDKIGGQGFKVFGYSTAVVRIRNYHGVKIIGNRFQDMIGVDCEQLHAIYLAHGASNNEIVQNTFTNGCGDPIRARDRSDSNIIIHNRFRRVGARAAFSEWYCGGDRACTKTTGECPSRGNLFEGNELESDFRGAQLTGTLVHQRPIPPECQLEEVQQ